MWSRKRLDIGWSDLVSGVISWATRWNRGRGCRRVERLWSEAGDALACLSVRSGWDLWLSAQNFPAGSEVLMSAVTVPDMVQIVAGHGLVPVPLDIEPGTLAPTVETLRQRITPATRAVLVAHLFGVRIPLGPLIAAAREQGLCFVEDCAQAYAGPGFRGHPDADVSMFSFGPIKTATALGGAVLQVRDSDVARRMRDRLATYPVQSRGSFFRRAVKYTGLKWLSTPGNYRRLMRFCERRGRDFDRFINSSVRGFAQADSLERFRRQPSAPLLGLLERRLRRFPTERLARQAARGAALTTRLRRHIEIPGQAADEHHYWVYAVLTSRPAELIAALRQAGFDATQGQSLAVVPAPPERPDREASVAQRLLAEVVFVPFYPELTDAAVEQLGDLLESFGDG